ncbi:hypothetical protein HJC23_000238 [Cyclotella cryptica]|uniref:ShKT domain-containing protein n=1 Tax=Cyclotella cryptica TaxID=29204 RepID=A0ABD3PMX2_9STRA|eukprot:CCRYP_013398-RA/>CCRYP_013398-RA protein AED:0.04 eAED:0.04 QI:433/1/1/1/1/1/3/2122/777
MNAERRGVETPPSEEETSTPSDRAGNLLTAMKLAAASALFYTAGSSFAQTFHHLKHESAGNSVNIEPDGVMSAPSNNAYQFRSVAVDRAHRRLLSKDDPPSYMEELFEDLKARKKLMEETPPEEVKYWFEYTGPLQKYFYRYSRSRKKADSFEGRDDSGVVSSRFVEQPGGGREYSAFFSENPSDVPKDEIPAYTRLLDNCLAMGSEKRPDRSAGSVWAELFADKDGNSKKGPPPDRCRILFTLNTVGASRGTTMLWETRPPLPHSAEPRPWISEQETAATHLERNLQEIDAMCATGLIAARVQVLVCEPIPGVWTDWMDSMLPNCGGRLDPMKGGQVKEEYQVEERASPVQVVVTANPKTADVCHDLKSGFIEQRMQDLVLSPPYLTGAKVEKDFDPSVKTTHRDLVSSDDHDLYVAFKWSTLVTMRGVNAFLQASADLAIAAASRDSKPMAKGEEEDGVTVVLSNSPASPFLIPSFVRVSYVSEENNKVAKWRMHGDFFHPAAWEICKDSFDMSWIPESLSGSGGVTPACQGRDDCGQWWIYFAEEQMPTSPEIYANEVTAPLVQGGSNYIWMVTERQRQELVKVKVCVNAAGDDKKAKEECGDFPQAVIPLGDLESFLMNFTPNTALGKKHSSSRFPGYSRAEERAADREKVRERKQLKDQEDIEKALFDYTIYPAALFHKDATIKAARARDFVLTGAKRDPDAIGPQKVKSAYYDVTITKPREATSAWCQSISRKGLCTLYADYFRSFVDERCLEACGMLKNWSKIDKVTDEL